MTSTRPMLVAKKLFNPRKLIRIGSWILKTKYAAGTAQLLAHEMQRYQLDILGVSESRWTGRGKINLPTEETIFYSGDESEHARRLYM